MIKQRNRLKRSIVRITIGMLTLTAITLSGCGASKNKSQTNSESVNADVKNSGTEDTETEAITISDNKESTENTESNQNVESIASNEQKSISCDNMNQVMYAQKNVNVRSGPSTDYEKVGSLSKNQEITITGKSKDTGWYRFDYNGTEAYVSDSYIGESPVENNGESQSDSVSQSNLVSSSEPASSGLTNLVDTGDADLNQQCDKILNGIISNNMASRDKAYAIYTWITGNIRYSGNTAEDGWCSGAKNTISTGKGNCYGFYSVSAALLTRAGFQNQQVNEPNYSHYWNIVNVDGSWYHWDTTKGWGGERFLLTDAQLEAYSYYNERLGQTLTYNWDHSTVPATP